MNRFALASAALLGAAAMVATPAAALAHTPGTTQRCAPAQPGHAFYEAGRIASVPVTVSGTSCSTISISHVRDATNPADTCQVFLLAFTSPTGSDPTYTDPVRVCSNTPSQRTVLATDVPDGTVFQVIYQVEYIDPAPQNVRFTVWS